MEEPKPTPYFDYVQEPLSEEYHCFYRDMINDNVRPGQGSNDGIASEVMSQETDEESAAGSSRACSAPQDDVSSSCCAETKGRVEALEKELDAVKKELAALIAQLQGVLPAGTRTA